MATSQHNAYAPGHAASQVEHHEWRTAENSTGYLLDRFKLAVRENPHLKLLDVGAGSGTISTSLAKYMPEGELFATDVSDEILERAMKHAESQGVPNIIFQKADAYLLPFPDSVFDITHAHQVLGHLDAPIDALKEMFRVTKPGGMIAVRESDLLMWCIWPEMPTLLKFHNLVVKTHLSNGGQVKAGRQLVAWSLAAGAAREDVAASFGTWCYSHAMVERLRHGQLRSKSLELSITTEEELDEMSKGWEVWSETSDATLGIVNGEIIVQKPLALHIAN